MKAIAEEYLAKKRRLQKKATTSQVAWDFSSSGPDSRDATQNLPNKTDEKRNVGLAKIEQKDSEQEDFDFGLDEHES